MEGGKEERDGREGEGRKMEGKRGGRKREGQRERDIKRGSERNGGEIKEEERKKKESVTIKRGGSFIESHMYTIIHSDQYTTQVQCCTRAL